MTISGMGPCGYGGRMWAKDIFTKKLPPLPPCPECDHEYRLHKERPAGFWCKRCKRYCRNK